MVNPCPKLDQFFVKLGYEGNFFQLQQIYKMILKYFLEKTHLLQFIDLCNYYHIRRTLSAELLLLKTILELLLQLQQA